MNLIHKICTLLMLGLIVSLFLGCGYNGTRSSDKPYNAYNYDSYYRGRINVGSSFSPHWTSKEIK